MNDTPTWMRGPELRAALAHAEIEILSDLVRIHIAMLCLSGPKLLALPYLGAARGRAGDLQRARMHYADQRRRLERLERGEPEPQASAITVVDFNEAPQLSAEDIRRLREVLAEAVLGAGTDITIH